MLREARVAIIIQRLGDPGGLKGNGKMHKVSAQGGDWRYTRLWCDPFLFCLELVPLPMVHFELSCATVLSLLSAMHGGTHL